jgi:GNAT superfamily N-acetyltransferase
MTDASSTLALRPASAADIPLLNQLANSAIEDLLKPYLTAEQIFASHEIMGIDTQLIEDGTYFVVELNGTVVGCGGWSRRVTHFGGDHSPGRDGRLLDPESEPARVRAMYTLPVYARRGIGRAVLARCEEAVAHEGFKSVELVATMSGVPLYRACGYRDREAFEEQTPSGIGVPLLRMRKEL